MIAVNNELFSFGGRIGRVRYLLNSCLISLLFFLAFFLLMGVGEVLKHNVPTEKLYHTFVVLAVCPVLVATYMLRISNCYKRLRDIYRIEQPSLFWAAGLFIPILSLVLAVFLLFAPGGSFEDQLEFREGVHGI